jgi:hypothetical protein
MKKFKVKHLVLCEVSVWRTIQAESFEDAMAQVYKIDTVTSTSTGADYEIVHDVEIKALSIKEDVA